MPGTSRNF